MTEQAVFSFILVLSRVSAFIGFFPLFGQRQLPVMVKAGLATALTSFWYATVPANNYYVAEHVPAFAAVLMIAQEVGVGLFLAMMLGFLLVPAKIAGAYVGQEVGLSLAAISDPGSTDQSTLVTIIFEALSVLLFFGLNLHHFLILFLDRSMNELANKISVLNLPTEGLIGMIDDMPEFGLMILAPLGIVMFLLVVALAFLNKAAPTMNLFSVGMSLRSGLGMVCLVLFMPVIIESMVMYFMRTIEQLEQMLGYFV